MDAFISRVGSRIPKRRVFVRAPVEVAAAAAAAAVRGAKEEGVRGRRPRKLGSISVTQKVMQLEVVLHNLLGL